MWACSAPCFDTINGVGDRPRRSKPIRDRSDGQSEFGLCEGIGTTVSERQAVGVMGFTAYFKDSERTLVGLWETATST